MEDKIKEMENIILKREWLKAIRRMVIEVKQVLEMNQEMPIEDRYDEEFFLLKINNIIENIDKKIKEE